MDRIVARAHHTHAFDPIEGAIGPDARAQGAARGALKLDKVTGRVVRAGGPTVVAGVEAGQAAEDEQMGRALQELRQGDPECIIATVAHQHVTPIGQAGGINPTAADDVIADRALDRVSR